MNGWGNDCDSRVECPRLEFSHLTAFSTRMRKTQARREPSLSLLFTDIYFTSAESTIKNWKDDEVVLEEKEAGKRDKVRRRRKRNLQSEITH